MRGYLHLHNRAVRDNCQAQSRGDVQIGRACACALILTLGLATMPASVSAQRESTRRERLRERRSERVARLDVAKINDPDTRDAIGPHSKGDAVVRAEILLDRLHFSAGEIGDEYNSNLAEAVAAFQAANGLPALGSVDAATWDALNREQESGHLQPKPAPEPNPPPQTNGQPPQPPPNLPPAIVPYVIALEDVNGHFTHLPHVRGQDAGERLILREAHYRELNYSSPLELLAEKFHSSPELLAKLNPRKGFRRPGERIEVPNIDTAPPPQAASVVVDASTHSVEALDPHGKVLAFYPASVGSEHDPLPVGNWKVTRVEWYPHYKYNPNLFWDSEDKHPRATLAAGPKNPVGVVWIQLSNPHYGIHGTPDPALIGKTQSHGCIRLTNWDASELARMVHPGTPALLEEGTPSHAGLQGSR
jgi:lipoprotein-anchoring transpeptidase ErfK/SrfK